MPMSRTMFHTIREYAFEVIGMAMADGACHRPRYGAVFLIAAALLFGVRGAYAQHTMDAADVAALNRTWGGTWHQYPALSDSVRGGDGRDLSMSKVGVDDLSNPGPRPLFNAPSLT